MTDKALKQKVLISVRKARITSEKWRKDSCIRKKRLLTENILFESEMLHLQECKDCRFIRSLWPLDSKPTLGEKFRNFFNKITGSSFF